MKTNDTSEDARINAGKNISFWTETVQLPALNPLRKNVAVVLPMKEK